MSQTLDSLVQSLFLLPLNLDYIGTIPTLLVEKIKLMLLVLRLMLVRFIILLELQIDERHTLAVAAFSGSFFPSICHQRPQITLAFVGLRAEQPRP